MSSGAASQGLDIPASEIREALSRVAASGPFERSGQLQRLLRFVIEETLAGRGGRLKEYVIGVEVFGRPASFDPHLDSLVRVEAHRLRVALETYYREEGRPDRLVIELRRGSYVPLFRRAASEADGAGPAAGGTRAPLLEPASATGVPTSPHVTVPGRSRSNRGAQLAAVVLTVVMSAALAAAAALLVRSRGVEALTERDSIVISAFRNSTGETVFDETLRQGLTMELEESPFLNIVSDRRLVEALKLMRREPGEQVTPELARELCLRTGSAATVEGSIARLGTHYVIGLTTNACGTGDAIAHVQVQAMRREAVLPALNLAASRIRSKLGESLKSIQRFETPVEEATTASLDALHALSLGRRAGRAQGSAAEIPFYRRAIELDPEFGIAHAALGVAYLNIGQGSLGGEHLKRAYELRERVSEREKYRISAYYHHAVTGDLEQASAIYELWRKSYRRDFAPHLNLGLLHIWLGAYQLAVAETEEALRLEPGNVLPYTNLAALHIKLDRPAEAGAVLDRALARNFTGRLLRGNMCYLAFLRGDARALERYLADARGKPGEEDLLLALHADTEAYHGRLRSARTLSRLAGDSATRAGALEAAALWIVTSALHEAEVGNKKASRDAVEDALRLAPRRDVIVLAALASARAGDPARAEALSRDLETHYPQSSILTLYWLPTIRAAVELANGRHSRAADLLRAVSPYELASPPPIGLATLYPVYLRGEANLLAGDGAAANREFQKILARRGLVLSFPLGSLAQLQSGRARALAGDRAGARQSYDAFFRLWAAADADLPILRQARVEYTRLREPRRPFNR